MSFIHVLHEFCKNGNTAATLMKLPNTEPLCPSIKKLSIS